MSAKNFVFKTLIICLTLVNQIVSAQTAEPDKPHYFTKNVVLCPIDITQLYTKEGFLRGNKVTLDISTDSLDGAFKEQVQTQRIERIDTVFKYPIAIEKGFAYNIIRQVGSFTIIKFWPIATNDRIGLLQSDKKGMGTTEGDDPMKRNEYLNSPDILEIDGLEAHISISGTKTEFDLSKSYYLIKTNELNSSSVEFENKKWLWSLGILVMPVKIRPFATEKGQFDFSNGFSVGTTFSCTVRHNWKTNFTHNGLLYIGISSYVADSTKIKEERGDYQIATFSPALGWMLEKNGIQLSILTGIDFPSGNLQQKWVYRNRPWVGLGVGIGLFKIDNEKNSNNQKNK